MKKNSSTSFNDINPTTALEEAVAMFGEGKASLASLYIILNGVSELIVNLIEEDKIDYRPGSDAAKVCDAMASHSIRLRTAIKNKSNGL